MLSSGASTVSPPSLHCWVLSALRRWERWVQAVFPRERQMLITSQKFFNRGSACFVVVKPGWLSSPFRMATHFGHPAAQPNFSKYAFVIRNRRSKKNRNRTLRFSELHLRYITELLLPFILFSQRFGPRGVPRRVTNTVEQLSVPLLLRVDPYRRAARDRALNGGNHIFFGSEALSQPDSSPPSRFQIPPLQIGMDMPRSIITSVVATLIFSYAVRLSDLI